MSHVLIVDKNQTESNRLYELIQKKGYQATIAPNFREAVQFSREMDIDAVLMNSLLLHEKNGSGLQKLHETASAPEIIILSENGSSEEAEFAIKQGAWDYIVSPRTPQAILNPLAKIFKYREKKQNQHASKQPTLKAPGIIGNSARLKHCLATLMKAAKTDANVLISGETGTGKELFATALHENSPRYKKNFVVVDCAALPETLVESTLFGHEKGAFTGATQRQCGLIKQADGGTLFLDEVGELPLAIQKSFLRVLEERRFRMVGGRDEIKSDFRLVAATNLNLDAMAAKGTFREDLLFRLRTFGLQLPPLRSRQGDIAPLARYCLDRCRVNNPAAPKDFSSDYIEALKKYHWPGNVRELFHAIERSMAASEDSTLYPCHLPVHIRVEIAKASLPRSQSQNASSTLKDEVKNRPDHAPAVVHPINPLLNLQQVREEVLSKTEAAYLEELLRITDGNMAKAIKISGLSRSRFYQLLKNHNLRSGSLR